MDRRGVAGALGVAVLAVLAFALAAGCGDDGQRDADADGASTEGAASMPVDGVSEWRTIVVDGTERRFKLVVPPGLDPSEPVPLVMSMHGLDVSASVQEGKGMNATAAEEGFVVAYPDAVDNSWDLTGRRDVDFIDALIDDVATAAVIDRDRVYAIGHSQGASFSTYLACHLPNRITAVASVAMMIHHDPPFCDSPRPARLLVIVGASDAVYSITDGLMLTGVGGERPQPLDLESDDWAATNECDVDPVEDELETGALRREFTCSGESALTIYIHSGGHWWPTSDDGLAANTIIWDFLSQYSKPLAAA